MLQKIILSNTSKTTLTIRLIVGTAFPSKSIQKILYPAVRDAGRFKNIRLPSSGFGPVFLSNLLNLFTVTPYYKYYGN